MFPDDDDSSEKVYVSLTVLEQLQKLRDEFEELSAQATLVKARSDNSTAMLDILIHSVKQNQP